MNSLGFHGESVHSLDAKNRVVVPKRFQNELTPDASGALSVVLTRGVEDCVYLFSIQGYQEYRSYLQSKPFGDRTRRAILRKLFSKTYPVQLDASGRVLVPETLKRYAGLDKEVVMLGVNDRAELWDRSTWERYDEEHEEDFQNLDQVLTENSTPPPGA